MSNQTIDGVSRELLEVFDREHSPPPKWAVEQLRALLAKPAEQHQGEPARWMFIGDDRREHLSFSKQTPDSVPLYTRPAEQPTQKYDDTLLPFVALMRKELHANAGKGDRPGWLAMSSDTCLLEIIYHFGKLQASVKRGDGDGMAEYAADVANMCMMLLDICGVLAFVENPAPVTTMDTPECRCKRYGKNNPHWPCPVHSVTSEQPTPVAVVPEGWQLVPAVPTDDMIVAFAEAWYSKRQTIDDPDMIDAYRDMLVVAPIPGDNSAQTPVAVVLPVDWQDQLFAEMDRRFELRKFDEDHMANDDTQIGVEFAMKWIADRLDEVARLNPPQQ